MARKGTLTNILGGLGEGFGSGLAQGIGLSQRQKESNAQNKLQNKRISMEQERIKLENSKMSKSIMNMVNKFTVKQQVNQAAQKQREFENWMAIGGNVKMPENLRKESWKKIASFTGMSDIAFEIEKTPQEKLPQFFKGLDALLEIDEVKDNGRISMTKLMPHLSRFINVWREIGVPSDIGNDAADKFISAKRNEEPLPVKQVEVSLNPNEQITKEFSDGRLTEIVTKPRKIEKVKDSKRTENQIAKDIRSTLNQLARKTGKYNGKAIEQLKSKGRMNPYVTGMIDALDKLKQEYFGVTGNRWDDGE